MKKNTAYIWMSCLMSLQVNFLDYYTKYYFGTVNESGFLTYLIVFIVIWAISFCFLKILLRE